MQTIGSTKLLPFPAAGFRSTFDGLNAKQRQAIDGHFLDGQGLTLVDELAGVGDDTDCVRHVRFWQREIAAHRAAAMDEWAGR